jgi:sodium/proline symporter
MTIALTATSGVFSLVLIAWSALGATIGPVLVVRLAGAELSDRLAIAMMASGLATVMAWGASPLGDSVFKALPGFVVPFLVFGIARLLGGFGGKRRA